MFVFGGTTDQMGLSSDLYALDLENLEWEKIFVKKPIEPMTGG